MTEYETASGKPGAILTGYGTVRGAELRAIYEYIDEATPRSGVDKRFGRPKSDGSLRTDHVDDCIRFLQTLDMVEVTAQDVLRPLNSDIHPEFPFELRLLHHIRRQEGEQYHLAHIYDVLVDMNLRRVGLNDPNPGLGDQDGLLYAVRNNTDYELTWREEKMRMWANLHAPLGAVSYSSDEDEIVASPSRGLLFDALSYYQAHGDDPNGIVAALRWIDENLLPCLADRPGTPKVHVGFADVLSNLEDDEAVTLRGMSDTEESVKMPRADQDTLETLSTFEVHTKPNRPAYWYPLERDERRVKA